LMYKFWEEKDDDRKDNQYAKYRGELNTLAMRETYGDDLMNLKEFVSDY